MYLTRICISTLFKIPQKAHHALLIVTDLAERYEADLPLSLEKIARKECLSQGFLEEIAGQLSRAGIIRGRRGAGGGYVLAKDPATLTVSDVVTAVAGPIAPVVCLSDRVSCALTKKCTNRSVWAIIQRQAEDALSRMTIQDVIKGITT